VTAGRPLLAALSLLACRPDPPDLPPAPVDPAGLLADRCERGDGTICVEVAAAHRAAGDLARSAAYLTRACDLASARGCLGLADALTRGDGVPQDLARALDLKIQACLGGLAEACNAAADAMPAAQSAEFRRRACAAGDKAACPTPPPAPPSPVDPRDQARVTLALAGRRADLRACYEAALADAPGLRGAVVLQIAVGPEGLARAVAVLEGLTPAADACMARVAQSTAYAPTTTGGVVIVVHRARFAPE
jgi:hypothetical protein